MDGCDSSAAPKFTGVTACCFHSGLVFPAILGATIILDKDDSAQES